MVEFSDRNSKESQESLVDKSIRQAQDLEPRKLAAKSTAKTAWNRQTVCEALVKHVRRVEYV